MRGRVEASRLNVRARPERRASIRGQLPRGSIVEILGERAPWIEIAHRGGSGFVHGGHLARVGGTPVLRGRVTARALNVRAAPDPAGTPLGTLMRGAIVEVAGRSDEWIEIEHSGSFAYVHGDHVDLFERDSPGRGRVTPRWLNVRSRPTRAGALLGVLPRDALVTVSDDLGDWLEIHHQGAPAYVAARYVELGAAASGAPRLRDSTHARGDLEPDVPLPEGGSGAESKVARTWNRFGGLLSRLAEARRLEAGSAVAVLCVESSGAGFEDDRMIIRFENHQFWRRWGRRPGHVEIFETHFEFDDEKPWKEHRFRETRDGRWRSFHGNQDREWQVLDFARGLDEPAALQSISMGAPQIMGFNHEAVGYGTPRAMFDAFGADVRAQILGLFDFLDDRMERALRRRDFIEFARFYNGAGQAADYGGWIQRHYDAFVRLSAGPS